MRQPLATPGPAPDAASLRQAALTHLARYSTTEAGLLRVLSRRVERWAYRAEAAPEIAAECMRAARDVVAGLVATGIVDDAAYAAGRARALHRAGRSRRAITAALQAKGVSAAQAAQPDDPEAEFAAALLYASRRRMGPFGTGAEADADQRRRNLARMARAGFSGDVARRALDLPSDQAEAALLDARLP